MAYLGHKPAVGENNSFRILDDISSFVLTFDGSSASAVGLSDETITITENNHRFITGQRVTYSNGGGGNITGLTNGQAYFVINHSKTQIKLASSASNALAGTAVNLTGLGTGSSHTLTLAFDGVNTKFDPTFGNGMHDTLIKRAAQLVISINGVIQQPHDTATPTTGFGVDSLGHIIFSTAPVSTDIFWGHILASNTVTFDSSDNDVDTFTGNGSTTSFTLSKIPPDNRNILVTIDGVVQYPSDAANTRSYNVSENVMTFTAAPGLGTVIQVRHIGYAGVSGGGGGGVTGFYGRTGNVSLQSTDNIVANNATFNGNVSIAQTLTYEDVTDIDSVGLITARSGIKDQTLTAGHVVFAGTGGRLSGEAELFYDSSNNHLGIGSATPGRALTIKNSEPRIRLQKPNLGHGEIYIDDDNSINLSADSSSSVGASSIIFRTNGAEKVRIMEDEVGIGTNNPASIFHLNSSSTAEVKLTLQNTGGTTAIYGNNDDIIMDADKYRIRNNNGSTEYIRILSDGKVGIGTVNPDHNLHVHSSSGDSVITIESTGNGSHSALEFFRTSSGGDGKGAGSIYVTGDTSTSAAKMKFGVAYNISHGTNSRMTIEGQYGRVGIGTENPTDILDVYSITDPTIRSRSGSASVGANIEICGGSSNDSQLIFSSGTTSKYQIFRDGSQSDDLRIYDSANSLDIMRYRHGGYLHFGVNGNERFRITSDGKFSLGTINASPSAAVHIDYDTNNMLMLDNSTSSTQKIFFAQNAVTHAQIYATSVQGSLIFESDPSDNHNTSIIGFNIDGGAKLQIGSSGNFTFFNNTAVWNTIQRATATHYVGLRIQEADGTQRMQFGVAGGANNIVNGAAQHDVVLKAYDANLLLATNSTERLRITSAGEVKIKHATAGQTVLSCEGLYDGGSNTSVNIATFARQGGAVKTAIRYNDPTTSMMFGTITSHNFGIMVGGTERIRISSSYARVGINTDTFDNAGSQLKIEGRGAGTTTPPMLQIKGVGSGVLHSYVDLIATSDNNSGNSYRGLGVVMYDEPTDVEWFSGRPYAGSDAFIIGRKSSTSYRTQSGEVANSLFRITSDGEMLIPGNQTVNDQTGKLDIYHTAPAEIDSPHIRLWGPTNQDARIEFGSETNTGEGAYISYNDSDEGLYIGSRMATYSEVHLCTGMNDGSPHSNARLTVNSIGKTSHKNTTNFNREAYTKGGTVYGGGDATGKDSVNPGAFAFVNETPVRGTNSRYSFWIQSGDAYPNASNFIDFTVQNAYMYRVLVKGSHSSATANIAQFFIYGLANNNGDYAPRIEQVTTSTPSFNGDQGSAGTAGSFGLSSGSFSCKVMGYGNSGGTRGSTGTYDTTLRIEYSGNNNQGLIAFIERWDSGT